MPVVHYIVAAFLYLLLFLWKRKWDLSLLVAYMYLVLAYTVLTRDHGGDHSYGMEVFWSYKAIFAGGFSPVSRRTLLIQMIANVVMFVPIGYLAGRLIGWKSIILSFVFSAIIETVQLVTNRGLFEFDDILHNTIGASLGFAIFVLLQSKKRSSG